jgi:hypothetical protein
MTVLDLTHSRKAVLGTDWSFHPHPRLGNNTTQLVYNLPNLYKYVLSDVSYQDNLEDVSSIPIASPIGRKRGHRHHGPPSPELQQADQQEAYTEVTLEQLKSILTDLDDYYTNPLVSHSVYDYDDIGIVDELDRMISQLSASLTTTSTVSATAPTAATAATTAAATAAPSNTCTCGAAQANLAAVTTATGVLPSLLRPDVSNQQNTTFPSDPYNIAGKIVKNARIYIESVDIPANSSWSGGIDFLEEGRLLAFSITCNDPDITPTLFIENASGTTDVINDMSFRQAVQHGRGMTLSEATSTFMQNGVATSRDVSGQPSPVFPYVKRYKDTLGGSGVYEDVRNTENDKSYVMNFEPTTSIPYQRLSFQVFNGSSLGTRMINRLEIKRLVYVDPDPVIQSSMIPSDLSQLTTALGVLAGNINKHPSPPPPVITAHPVAQAHFASEGNVFDDYIRYAYKRLNDKNNTTMKFHEPEHVSSIDEQKEVSDLLKIASGESVKPNKHINNGSDLIIKWE